jgi:hypothetical protein
MGVNYIHPANVWVQRQGPLNILKNLRGSIKDGELIQQSVSV